MVPIESLCPLECHKPSSIVCISLSILSSKLPQKSPLSSEDPVAFLAPCVKYFHNLPASNTARSLIATSYWLSTNFYSSLLLGCFDKILFSKATYREEERVYLAHASRSQSTTEKLGRVLKQELKQKSCGVVAGWLALWLTFSQLSPTGPPIWGRCCSQWPGPICINHHSGQSLTDMALHGQYDWHNCAVEAFSL